MESTHVLLLVFSFFFLVCLQKQFLKKDDVMRRGN